MFHHSVAFLDKQLPSGLPDVTGHDQWLPLMTYRNSLVQGDGDATTTRGATAAKSRARARGKKAQAAAAAAAGEWLSAGDTSSRDGAAQPLTSTAVKQQRRRSSAAGAGDVTGDADDADDV